MYLYIVAYLLMLFVIIDQFRSNYYYKKTKRLEEEIKMLKRELD